MTTKNNNLNLGDDSSDIFEPKGRTLETPQSVVESVIFSAVKRSKGDRKPTIFEERLLAHIILEAQQCLKGVKLDEHKSGELGDIYSLLTPEMQNQKYYPMCVPLKDIAGTSNNYEHIADACAALMEKIVRVDSDTHVRLRQLIVGVDYAKDGTGYITFDVPKEVWLALLDFSRGFRKYEIRMAAKLTNPYAYYLYKFVASQKGKEQDWPVSYLREQLQLKDKYPRLADFKQKILIPAINELDSVSPVSCSIIFYSSAKARGEERRGARTQDRVKITPVFTNNEGSHDELAYMLPGRDKADLLPEAVVKYLKNRLLYDDVSLKRHSEKLLHAYEMMKNLEGGFEGFLIDLTPKVDRARPNSYPKYVMACINKKIVELETSMEPDTVSQQEPVNEDARPVNNDGTILKTPKTKDPESGAKTIGDLLPFLWEN